MNLIVVSFVSLCVLVWLGHMLRMKISLLQKLYLPSSVIAGHRGAGLARFTTAAKSPMTNGIGEAHTEGPWGIAMKACGADILVFTGKSAEPVTVSIQDGKVEFHDAKTLWGKTVGETTDELERHMGTTIHVAAIGPAGENLVRFASVVSDRSAIRDLRTWLGLRYQRRLATHIEPLAHPWDPGKDPYGVYWPWQDQKL